MQVESYLSTLDEPAQGLLIIEQFRARAKKAEEWEKLAITIAERCLRKEKDLNNQIADLAYEVFKLKCEGLFIPNMRLWE